MVWCGVVWCGGNLAARSCGGASNDTVGKHFKSLKVWTTDLGSPANAVRSAEISIDELGLGPVDMVMVHWPMPGNHVAAYIGIEQVVKSGSYECLRS